MASPRVLASRRSAESATRASPRSRRSARRRSERRCSRRGSISTSCNAATASPDNSCRPRRCSQRRRSRPTRTSTRRCPATSAGAAPTSGSVPPSTRPPASARHHMDRRDFMKAGVTLAGGLVVDFALPLGPCPALAQAPSAAPFAPNAFIRIDRQNAVTLVMPMAEMGQGVYTAMAMLLAEELEVGLDQVRLEHAPADDALYANPLLQSQTVGNSTTIRGFWMPLRQAGAAARTMLIAAAAKRWSVDPSPCQAQRGAVVHTASARRLAYGELVDAAATLPVPARDTVPLKRPEDMSLVGKSVKRFEGPDKVAGRTEFGIDVRLPGMKIAAIAISPVLGGHSTFVNEQAALAIAGVRQVVDIGEAVAVVADHMWAAKKGLKAAAIRWDDGPHANVDMKTIVGQLEQGSRQSGAVAKNEGDTQAALAGARQRVDAVYQMPFLAHGAMEPMNCTVHCTKD